VPFALYESAAAARLFGSHRGARAHRGVRAGGTRRAFVADGRQTNTWS
jgi:hypothetical protein